MNIMQNKKKIGEINYSIEVSKANNPFLHINSNNRLVQEENTIVHN